MQPYRKASVTLLPFDCWLFGYKYYYGGEAQADCTCHLRGAESFSSFNLCADVQW